jgi:single-strand DNA-binding protein
MGSLNTCTLIGNLGRDPEVTYTQDGTARCKLSLATTHRAKDGEGWKDVPDWHPVIAFGKVAEAAAKLAKGRQVAIRGEIRPRSWVDNDGQKHYITEIHAHEVCFIGARDEARENSGEAEKPAPKPPAPKPTPKPAAQAAPDAYPDDDIPF